MTAPPDPESDRPLDLVSAEGPSRGLPRRVAVFAGLGAAAAGLAACSTTSAPTSGTTARSSEATGSSGATASAGPSPHTSQTQIPHILMTPGPDIVAGPRSSGEVALTFHGAGDPSIARAVLAALAAHQAEVTVFTVGTWARQHPDVVHALLGAGHDVGNHTWSHQPMRSLSAAAARVEVQRGAHAVAAVRGSAGALFRPSGTPTSTATIRAAAASAGYHRCISYDVDSLDYTDPGSTAIVRNVEATVRGGSIVSLHLGHPGTVAALPKILDLLTQRGLRAVTITRLLAHPGEPVLARS